MFSLFMKKTPLVICMALDVLVLWGMATLVLYVNGGFQKQ